LKALIDDPLMPRHLKHATHSIRNVLEIEIAAKFPEGALDIFFNLSTIPPRMPPVDPGMMFLL